VTDPKRWQPATLVSVLTTLALLMTIGSGVMWATVQQPLGYPNGMILHTAAAILLVVLYGWHMALRFRPLRLRHVQNRRTVTRLLGALLFGGLLWSGQEGANRLLDTAGARRRFTGSREAGQGSGNDAFPVTMWMFDRPAPVDRTTWRLRVSGAVAETMTLTYDELASQPLRQIEAILDCTGGWYTQQMWHGVGVNDLLARVQPLPSAVAVSFVSVTGYRWSLPLHEAADALLALKVGSEALSHGHGAPARLVAPGRRGFQWVKWVREVRVLTAQDWRQWSLIFTSGLPIR
jgi:DMSO/TMAO reductase YedYZ molybdopterin-dependent catalytic subunit